MTRTRTGLMAVVLAVTTATLVAVPATATADTFGHHVAACAQTEGFSGSHNPGMHQGASSWDGTGCTP